MLVFSLLSSQNQEVESFEGHPDQQPTRDDTLATSWGSFTRTQVHAATCPHDVIPPECHRAGHHLCWLRQHPAWHLHPPHDHPQQAGWTTGHLCCEVGQSTARLVASTVPWAVDLGQRALMGGLRPKQKVMNYHLTGRLYFNLRSFCNPLRWWFSGGVNAQSNYHWWRGCQWTYECVTEPLLEENKKWELCDKIKKIPMSVSSSTKKSEILTHIDEAILTCVATLSMGGFNHKPESTLLRPAGCHSLLDQYKRRHLGSLVTTSIWEWPSLIQVRV